MPMNTAHLAPLELVKETSFSDDPVIKQLSDALEEALAADDSAETIAELERQVTNLENELEEADKQVDILEAEKESLDGDKVIFQAEIARLESDIDGYTEALSCANRRFTSANERLDRANKRCELYKAANLGKIPRQLLPIDDIPHTRRDMIVWAVGVTDTGDVRREIGVVHNGVIRLGVGDFTPTHFSPAFSADRYPV